MSANLAEYFHNDNMLYFILGSLISSDNILTRKDAEESINTLSKIERDLDISVLEDNVKSEYKDMIKKCYEVLKSDLERFK